MGKEIRKFRICVDKIWVGRSFGICLSFENLGDAYLFINFWKWSISIGWIAKD